MTGRETDPDPLWDPTVSGDASIRELEALLAPLEAPLEAPPLELPPRAMPDAGARWSPGWRRGLVVAAVSIAAVCALWFAWRARPGSSGSSGSSSGPSSGPSARGQMAVAPAARAPQSDADHWRVEALDGEEHCRDPGEAGLGPGAAEAPPAEAGVPERFAAGATLDTGAGSSARLSRGAAQLELHPSSTLENVEGGLTLRSGSAWVDLPAVETGAPWRFGAGPLWLETPAARFMAHVRPGGEIELEVIEGSLSIAMGSDRGSPVEAHGGQRCRAILEPGPVAGVGAVECR